MASLKLHCSHHKHSWVLWFDISLFIGTMFLVRNIYFSQFNFIANGLFWSFSTLIVAMLLMKLRGITWRDIGLRKTESFKKSLLATIFIFVFTVISILTFQILKDSLGLNVSPDHSHQQASSKFGDLSGNWGLFIMIIPFIWLQSMLEELLDRGFLINWFEKALSSTWFATATAVLLQALIFGFRHSYDLSERSITVGLIGIAMGVGYACFGRNLWPLIVAHCMLNTMSMLDRV